MTALKVITSDELFICSLCRLVCLVYFTPHDTVIASLNFQFKRRLRGVKYVKVPLIIVLYRSENCAISRVNYNTERRRYKHLTAIVKASLAVQHYGHESTL